MASSPDRHLQPVPSPPPAADDCLVCGSKVSVGVEVMHRGELRLIHHMCEKAWDEHVRPTLFGATCDVCGMPCPEDRLRCDHCTPPELPRSYREARARLDQR